MRVVLGLQDVTINLLGGKAAALCPHYREDPSQVATLRNSTRHRKTGCGKAVPGEIPTGVESSRDT